MRTQLLSHNKTAYQKVMRAFETADRTCVVHPTGTGKSYLIAAVSESFMRVLILGPNTFVLDQVHSVLAWRDKAKDAGTVEYMTYSLLMYRGESPTGYDLICLDEFHRAGAPEWGEAVDRLLEANLQAKVLGTTATPIRFLDDNRDMADELFEGNIASYMTLKDAWDRNILATPRFVTGLFEFDKVVSDIEDRINKSRRIDEKEKKVRLTRVNNLRLDWERSQGMPQIIRKHIDEGAKRIIVFCGNVEHLKDMEQTVREWFRRAGRKVAEVYNVHAYMPDKELKAAMDGFEDDDFGEGGVKLMLSVNLLNEGVHIPRVNAVILLRTTSSKIIYLQQIGRCLTAANTDKPVILDMVDNITTTNLVHDIKEGFDWYAHQKNVDDEEREPSEPKDFVVYDYTLGIRQAIEKLVPVDWVPVSFEDRLARATAFCDKFGRVPGKRDNIEEKNNWYLLRDRYGNRQEVKDLVAKYHAEMTREEKIEWLQRYVKEKGFLPSRTKDSNEQECKEYRIYAGLRDENPCDPRVLELKEKYSIVKSDDRLLQEYLDFVEKNDRLPERIMSKVKTDEFNLADSVHRRLRNHPQVVALWEKYGKKKRALYKSIEERMADLEAFAEKENRLPNKKDGKACVNLKILQKANRKKAIPELEELMQKYSRKKSDETVAKEAQQVIDFIVAKGRRPIYTANHNERLLVNLMNSLLKTYSAHPKVQELAEVKEANGRKMSDEEVKAKIKAFVAKHNRLPLKSVPEEERLREAWRYRMDRLRAEDPEIQAIYDIYKPRRQSYEDFFSEVRRWSDEHGRLPKKSDGDIYRQWSRLQSTYINVPEVKSFASKYGYNPGKPLLDIDAILDDIKAYADEHGRMPSNNTSDRTEKKLARHWSRFKRRYADNPKLVALKERFPIQNRK